METVGYLKLMSVLQGTYPMDIVMSGNPCHIQSRRLPSAISAEEARRVCQNQDDLQAFQLPPDEQNLIVPA